MVCLGQRFKGCRTLNGKTGMSRSPYLGGKITLFENHCQNLCNFDYGDWVLGLNYFNKQKTQTKQPKQLLDISG